MKIRIILFLATSLLVVSCLDRSKTKNLTPVKPVDLASIELPWFTQEEWYIPYYLKHFSSLANSLVDTGQNRGYIQAVVWRTPDVNKPYNARIMENILSLAWFYTTDRPWNPYYGDPALRQRLETAITFWCNIQNEDGRFSEYAPDRWSLAPTAFATKFVGRALYLLETGPAIDKEVLVRANASLRKALFVSFTDSALWQHGRNFTNQYANLWGGAMMYLQHHPDQTIDQLLNNRLNDSMVEFQSPCGYFYEKNGPDWGYNLSTHHSDLQVAWHFAKGTRLEDYFIEKTARWYDWFSYNAVLEPGTSRFYLNKAVETRQQEWYVDTDTLEDPRSARWTPQAEKIPIARAFVLSQEEYNKEVQRLDEVVRSKYPATHELKEGEFWAFSPYAFLHNELNRWLPSREQKEQAVRELPYLKNENFTQVRHDPRNETQYSFVRRPAYYAIFNTGKIITDQQRYGLGLIWNPVMGTMFQSQSKSDAAAWGTRPDHHEQVYEASDVTASFYVNDNEWKPGPGENDVEGSFRISYPLSSSGKKSVTFSLNSIEVNVDHKGSFTEVIPILVDEETTVQRRSNRVMLTKSGATMELVVNVSSQIELLSAPIKIPGEKSCRVIEIKSNGRLNYTLSIK